MAKSTDLTLLRDLSYGQMRYWVDENIPDLRVISTAELSAGDVMGFYSASRNVILISLGMTYTQKRCTLVHELVHWRHGDTGAEHEARTRTETAGILIDPAVLEGEAAMYGTDYEVIADDMDVTEGVLRDYLASRGVAFAGRDV